MLRNDGRFDVVTGAFGYTGRYIARALLARGRHVRTLTGHPGRENPFGARVDVQPFHFESPNKLVESLQGAAALYNTYWIRFERGRVTFDQAVERSRLLVRAAAEAGVERIVHVSITNPSEGSDLPYFRGKAMVERAIRESGMAYAILRPAVLFGREDILINNVAWLLRRFPIFGVPGSGRYGLQPVFVEDFAEIAVAMGEKRDNVERDVVGPEVYSFDDLVRLLADTVNSRARIVHVSPHLALMASKAAGLVVRDVLLTRDELKGLMRNLLVSPQSPLGRTRLSDWLAQNANNVGTTYASELQRHYR